MISKMLFIYFSSLVLSTVYMKQYLVLNQSFSQNKVLSENLFPRNDQIIEVVNNELNENKKSLTLFEINITEKSDSKRREIREVLHYPKYPKLLCDNTYINAADRIPENNSVRVYRDNFYWELYGLPDPITTVEGPFPIWYQNMAPMDRYSSIQTIGFGALKGVTFKYKGDRFWSWHKNGKQRTGNEDGEQLAQNTPHNGFDAVYNDDNLDGKGFSQMIAFNSIRVYYYNTSGSVIRPIGDPNGYIEGKDNQSFPGDLTAAFPFPNKDSNNYYVYLFLKDKHCFKQVKTNYTKCIWTDNKQLFGCNKDVSDTMGTTTSTSNSLNTQTKSQTPTQPKNGSLSSYSIQLDLLLFLVLDLILFFKIYF